MVDTIIFSIKPGVTQTEANLIPEGFYPSKGGQALRSRMTGVA